jgi:hypothetical protein
MDTPQMLEVSRQLSAALKPADLDQTLSNITAAAVEVLPEVKYASITVKHADDRLETFAATDPVILDIDAFQYSLREGPCYEAATDTVHLTAPNLDRDTRFPNYAPHAVSLGVHAQAGIRLFETEQSNGALNLYSDTPGSFEDFDALSELFAHQAAVALAYAREVGHLQTAVKSRQMIGQAVGIVMERFQLDEAHAFAFLARISSHRNIKLRLVAQAFIDEGKNAPA